MSLVTRCPACATTFKVVRDQLRISDGWVRCGRCSEVFDATIELQEAPDPELPVPVPVLDQAPSATSSDDGADTPFIAPHAPTDPLAAVPADLGIHDEAEIDFLDDDPDPERPSPASDRDPRTAAPDFDLDAPAAEGLDSSWDDLAPSPSSTAAVPANSPRRAATSSVGPSSTAYAPRWVPSTGVVSDEPWREDRVTLPPVHGQMAVRPPPAPKLPFPDIDLNLPFTHPDEDSDASPSGRETGNALLQTALRRARVKAVKIATAKARSEKAARPASPVIVAASETEADAEPGPSEPAALEDAHDWRRSSFDALPVETPAAKPADRRRTVARVVWAAGIVAALLLVLQVMRQERDLIVARQPAMRPVMAALCGMTGCQLSALRQIGDITVDGASFARERGNDGYLLTFTLRNGASIPLAMPSIELTLLDTQERAVVRRVLAPAEFRAPPVLPARAEQSASLSMTLTGAEVAALPPVAGFRMAAFYP